MLAVDVFEFRRRLSCLVSATVSYKDMLENHLLLTGDFNGTIKCY